MAQRTTVQLIDDLDGTEGKETLLLSLDGTAVEIDLSTKNADKLRAAVKPYFDAGRRSGGRRGGGRRGRSSSSRSNSADVRAWARSQGIELSDRGRIPGSVQQQYDDAH